ncbi:MAG: hypothetical protein QNJ31_03765 [Candidatus Caenarcaniphilales bacterium]|nr:hypothetical protein [Candidatus Caenarcaniphilales bacterium]
MSISFGYALFNYVELAIKTVLEVQGQTFRKSNAGTSLENRKDWKSKQLRREDFLYKTIN